MSVVKWPVAGLNSEAVAFRMAKREWAIRGKVTKTWGGCIVPSVFFSVSHFMDSAI
jgi:hypothetical protein